MQQYVHARSGSLHCLFSVEGVLEILDNLSELDGQAGDRAEWRGSVIPRVPVASAFEQSGAASAGAAAIIYRPLEAEKPLLLTVDQIMGIERIDTEALRPLPPLPERLLSYFDAVVWDAGRQVHALRVRYPLSAPAVRDLLGGATGQGQPLAE